VRWDSEADFIVVGTGAAGATAGMVLAEARQDILLLEEGGWYQTKDFTEDLFSTMAHLLRDFGAQVAYGRSVFPVMQASCVGGTTVINGAIVHRLPHQVYREWAKDRAIAKGLEWDNLERSALTIERDLGIKANLGPLLSGLPVTNALKRLGWRHQAMVRNAPECQHTGRCLQGCPSGGKLSMERSYIPRALTAGARLRARCRVERILIEQHRAVGVMACERLDPKEDGGSRRLYFRARRGVVLAAGAVHTPLLLLRSGIRNPQIGRHFQCHPGTAVVALFDRPTVELEGPPMGHEILEFEGIKLASQTLPLELLPARLPACGRELTELLGRAKYLSAWTCTIKSTAEGTVKPSWGGRAHIRFTPSPEDMGCLRMATGLLSKFLFELGARTVYPGVWGLPAQLTSPDQLDLIERASLDPRDHSIVAGHLFGTCRLGSDPRRSVVGPDFQVHGIHGLSVIDASMFPSNIGVNPQHSIMALAMCAAEKMLAREI
jgi:choline dehydrogenase-like flavoprotein